MRRFVQNEGMSGATASLPPRPPGDPADGHALTRLLEEVARRVSFPDDAAFYVAGPTGKILFISAGFNAIAGALPENGHVADDVFNFIRNNNESYIRDEVANFGDNTQPRFVRSFHYPLHDEEGGLLGLIGHYVDASGLTAALIQAGQQTARQRDQLRASSDLFWELDADGKLTALSDRASGILGKPAISFLGQELTAIGRFVERSGAAAQSPLEFFKQQPFRNALFLMPDENGQPHYFHMSAVPVFEAGSGRYQGFRGAGVDVTERLRAEDMAAEAHRDLEQIKETLLNRNIQLDIERARAEKALRVKTEFLATMSHELRTPLNAILGFSETMTMKLFGPLSEQYSGYAGDILRSGQHLLSLIDTMLESARADAGDMSLNLEHIDISNLIEQAVSIVRLRAGMKNVDISKAAARPGWVVKADPMLVTQILVNLLSNAVKFTNANGAMGVDMAAGVQNGVPMASITIWDTGIGVPPEMQNRIFDKFVRGDDAVQYDDIGQGIGLGLHISRRLAELMQGSIRLQSIPGHGSRFTLELPLISTP